MLKDISVFYIRVENSSYVFVLFHNHDLFLCRMGRVCLASVSVGEAMAGGRKTTKIGALRVQTNKSAAIYKLRLIFLS